MRREQKHEAEFSEEFRLIIEKPPAWFMRSGLALLLSLFLALLIFCCIGRYPDSIEAPVKVVATNGRMSVHARTSGRIFILVSGSQAVSKGDPIAVIQQFDGKESLAIIGLLSRLTQIHQRTEVIYHDTVLFDETVYVDEMQMYYDDFLKKRREYFVSRNVRTLQHQKQELQRKLVLLSQTRDLQQNQNQLLEKKLEIENGRLSRASTLLTADVIAPTDFDDAREKMIDKLYGLEVARTELSGMEVNRQEILGQIREMDLKIIEDSIRYRGDLLDAYKLLFSKLRLWDDTHVLRAPCDGTVYFADHRSNYQHVEANEELVSVLPDDENVFGVAKIPAVRAGEVRTGQRVNIYLDSYWSEEYGSVSGKVKSVSPVPIENTYMVVVELPQGLLTSYQQKIPFTPELQGQARIVTKNTRIIEKIFNKFRRYSEEVASAE